MSQSTPVFISVSYNGQQLIAQWTDTQPSNFTGYQVTLAENAGVGEVFSVTTMSFNLQKVLTATSTYTLQVTMLVTGQPSITSSLVTLITQAPTLSAINNSGTEVAYTWTAASGAGVEAYIATLSSPATNWNSTTDAATLTTTFTQALAAAGTCTGWVRGASSDSVVLGPSSQTLTLLTKPPLSSTLGYTGTALRLLWLPSGEANVTGFSVELLSNGSSAETDTPTTSPQTFSTNFASGIVFTAQVRSIGPNTKGPWSTLAHGPYLAEITYTYDALGRLENVAWVAGFTETYSFDNAGNLLTASYPAT